MILCRQGQKKECIVLKKRRKKYDIKNGKKNPCNRIDSYDVCDNYLYWGVTVNAADFEEVQITEISAGVKIDTEIMIWFCIILCRRKRESIISIL